MSSLKIDYVPIGTLRPYAGNARTHSKRQIQQIARSIEAFGFTNAVLIGDDGAIIAGHGRVEAAKLLKMTDVPVVRLSGLTPAQIKAYVIADNKLALNAGWDQKVLATELQGLIDLGYEVELTGFSQVEIDLTLEVLADGSIAPDPSPDDASPPPADGPAVTKPGDLWRLGHHRIVCGDARDPDLYARLMDGALARMMFTDPPYNVKIDGNVCGLGAIRHREFAMAAGEMDRETFTAFLAASLGAAAKRCRDGAIAYVCMDWRHVGELEAAGRTAFTELKNLCVWAKTNGGMGTFYRSQHELVFVYKVGAEPHLNTFGLGDGGRYRTNVWSYPGVSSPTRSRLDDLGMHPTVKPVALVKDAILDVSRRGEIVLDPFGGSGSTLIAAEKCGRIARLIELDPLYCDVIVRRWETLTGKSAIREADDATFEDAKAA